jgi:hypothetical protein
VVAPRFLENMWTYAQPITFFTYLTDKSPNVKAAILNMLIKSPIPSEDRGRYMKIKQQHNGIILICSIFHALIYMDI